MYDRDNVFAKILRKEVECNLVYEDELSLAFHDIFPAAPLHVIVIPKGEFISFSHFMTTTDIDFVNGFFRSVQKVIALLQIEEEGYRIVSNTGVNGMQSIDHFHVHILAKAKLGALVFGSQSHA